MTHIEEEKVTQTTTYERTDDPPKEQVKNVNLNVTDNDGETVTVDETTQETTEQTQPNQVNVNAPR